MKINPVQYAPMPKTAACPKGRIAGISEQKIETYGEECIDEHLARKINPCLAEERWQQHKKRRAYKTRTELADADASHSFSQNRPVGLTIRTSDMSRN